MTFFLVIIIVSQIQAFLRACRFILGVVSRVIFATGFPFIPQILAQMTCPLYHSYCPLEPFF